MSMIKEWLDVIIAGTTAITGLFALFKSPPATQPPSLGTVKVAGIGKWWRKHKRRTIGYTLLLLATFYLIWRFWPEPPLTTFTRQELLTKAWKNYDRANWHEVERYTKPIVTIPEATIDKAVKELKTAEKPLPKTGVVGKGLSAEDESNNHEYGYVNDFVTAHYLTGQAYFEMKDRTKAREHFQAVKKYPFAVTYNPKTKEFWLTANGADNALLQLGKPENSTP